MSTQHFTLIVLGLIVFTFLIIMWVYATINERKQASYNMESELRNTMTLDCENQHLKYYQKGYRESILTLVHGEEKVWDEFGIDTRPYPPDGARDVSYMEGWNLAIKDYTK